MLRKMYADALKATIRSLEKERDEAKKKVQEFAEENSRLKSQLAVCLVEKEELKNQRKAQEITQTSGGFESLNDDTLGLILELTGNKSYYAYGAIDKRCREIYLSKNLPKETFLYGYAPLAVIQEKCTRLGRTNSLSVGYGVLYYNRRDVLEWALLEQEEHPYILNQIFNTAVEVGRLDILNEIYDRSTEGMLALKYHTFNSACNGSLDTLKWLDTRSYLNIFNIRICATSAAEGGHLNILLWLQTKLSFDEEMKRVFAASAAKSGHLNILVWLHENNFPFDEIFFWIAAEDGHLHVLEWLRDINCPWNKFCYKIAAKGGHLHVLDWLRDNGYPRGDAKIGVHEEQDLRDDVKVWLHNNGFSIMRPLLL